MPAVVGTLLVVVNLSVWTPSTTLAQTCTAASRSLVTLSHRMRLHFRDGQQAIIRDATACDVRSDSSAQALLRVRPIDPVAMVGYTGGVPDQDPGSVPWGGRGVATSIRTGVVADIGIVHVILAPAVTWSANRPFLVFPSIDSSRSSFASPWYAGEFSADLPTRHGADSWTIVEPGESAVWAQWGRLAAGLSSSTQSWGPGIRGGLLLGVNAPGIPRAFVRTSDFVATPAGDWAISAFTGALTESRFFDNDAANDRRRMDAGAVAWRPQASNRVTIGLAAATISRASTAAERPGGRPRNTMLATFVHAASLDGTLRVWTELARRADRLSMERFLRVPHHGVVYLVGFERAFEGSGHTTLLTAEAVNLEQPIEIREEAVRDFYTSAEIPHGWTHRGRVLGHGAGPGGQSQWVALTRLYDKTSFGLFGERVRRNEEAFFRQYLPYPQRHDVTIRGGISGAGDVRGREIAIEVSWGRRLNYLFQNTRHIQNYRRMDIGLPRLTVQVTPAPEAPR